MKVENISCSFSDFLVNMSWIREGGGDRGDGDDDRGDGDDDSGDGQAKPQVLPKNLPRRSRARQTDRRSTSSDEK